MFQELALAREATREALNARITHAWYGEVFARQKKLQKLETYLVKEKRPQTPDDQRLLLYRMAAIYGGKVCEVKD